MAEFVYNNIKNINTGYTLFELNYGYHPSVFFEDKTNLCSKSCLVNKLTKELRDLISVCQQNLLHTQELQKKTHNKEIKLRSYVPGKKIWLNSKYKLENKFFGLFQVLHPVDKQAYKLKLPAK